MNAGVVVLFAAVFLLPGMALAQVLTQRCEVDSEAPPQAEARVEWMRRCALTVNVHAPNWTCPSDYYEADPATNPTGRNTYTANPLSFDINTTYVNNLYTTASTSYVVDGDGYCKALRPASRKKTRPLYPVYGSEYDINSASNVQLFPHPTLASCGLYYDRNGTQPATGVPFYANGYCEAWSTTNVLTSAVPVGGLGGAAGSELYYRLDVPAGAANVVFETSGGTGDVDLYVRNGKPSTTAYDCRPLLGGNLEGCNMPSPAAGPWYVMLKGFSAYSGVSLKGTVYNRLTDGVASPASSGAQGSEQYFALEVPAGMSQLTFTLAGVAGHTGDADLYVRRGMGPTLSAFDCRPYIGGNSEVCSFSAPGPGTWYVMVRGWSAYSGVTVTGDYY